MSWTAVSITGDRSVRTQVDVNAQCGRVGFLRTRVESDDPEWARLMARDPPSRFTHLVYRDFKAPPLATQLGFATYRDEGVNGFIRYADRGLWIPLWLPLLLFALAPVAHLRRQRQAWRRGVNGLCVRCGYDLRASPGRCPECGAVPAAIARGPDKSS